MMIEVKEHRKMIQLGLFFEFVVFLMEDSSTRVFQ
jgi:hypothetical protein